MGNNERLDVKIPVTPDCLGGGRGEEIALVTGANAKALADSIRSFLQLDCIDDGLAVRLNKEVAKVCNWSGQSVTEPFHGILHRLVMYDSQLLSKSDKDSTPTQCQYLCRRKGDKEILTQHS